MAASSRTCQKTYQIHRKLWVFLILSVSLILFSPEAVSPAFAAEKSVMLNVKGETWDSCSRGFAFFGGLSKEEAEQTAARRGARVTIDGQPSASAVSGPGPQFELSFETDKPDFRLIVEGDRFPRLITQPIAVPKNGGEVDVGRVSSPRAEGIEHTWPLQTTAEKLGYKSTLEMLADNKAAIRLLVRGSGEEGTPGFANDSLVSLANDGSSVVPFTMNARDTILQMTGPRLGAFIIIVPFSEGEPQDKQVTLNVEDTISEPSWNPPRPWKYDPLTVMVRNGFATEVSAEPRLD